MDQARIFRGFLAISTPVKAQALQPSRCRTQCSVACGVVTKVAMPSSAHPIITDEIWDDISPLLPQSQSKRRLDDRLVLEGIVYVLSHGIAWYDLPLNLGYGSGMTCWRRLRDWHSSGVWDRIQKVLAQQL